MELGDAIVEALALDIEDFYDEGAYDDPGDLDAGLRDHFGSIAAAARELGIARSTLRGWLAGRTPKGHRIDYVRAELHQRDRERSLPQERADELRELGGGAIVVTGSLGYDRASAVREQREIQIGRYVPDNLPAQLVDAYLDGASADQLADIFRDSISGADFYTGVFAEGGNVDGLVFDIDSIDFGGGM